MPNLLTRCAVFASVALVAPVAGVAPASANDTAVAFVGQSPRAVEAPDVTLTSERLVFTWVAEQWIVASDASECPGGGFWAVDSCVVPGHWRAELEYRFDASADLTPRTIEIGLPFELPLPDTEHVGPAMGEPISGVQTLVDGEVATVRVLDDVLNGEGWAAERTYLVSVPFEPGQQRVLTHRYDALGWEGSGGARGFNYLLRTGAGWAGPIGSVEIRFELPYRTPCVMSSLPYRLDERVVVIELSDWEPVADLELTWGGPELLLLNNEIYAEGIDHAATLCGALAEPQRSTLRRRIELWFGAPANGDPLADEAPAECFWADAFAATAFSDSTEANDLARAEAVRALRYSPSETWQANLAAAPPWVSSCYAVLVWPVAAPPTP